MDFNLRSHMKTHTGEYNECPYENCDKRYCQEYKLRAHIAKEHTKTMKPTKNSAKVARNGVRGKPLVVSIPLVPNRTSMCRSRGRT